MDQLWNEPVRTPALLPVAVYDLDTPQFVESLMAAIRNSVARIDHCSIFHFGRSRDVRHIGTASVISRDGGNRSAQRYADELNVYDPLQKLLVAGAQNETMIFRLTPDKIRERRYRDSLAELRTIERLSILTEYRGDWYSLNLYRSEASGNFTHEDLERVNGTAPLLGSLAVKHSQLLTAAAGAVARPDAIEVRLRSLSGTLSSREIAVCKLALMGHRSHAIAEVLGLRYNTVLTYRKRAYVKLNISSQNELFRLCLN